MLYLASLIGTYKRLGEEYGIITIDLVSDTEIHIKGSAHWDNGGIKGPNVGELEFNTIINSYTAIFEDSLDENTITIELIFDNNKLTISEMYSPCKFGYFGMNVSFAGEYLKTNAV